MTDQKTNKVKRDRFLRLGAQRTQKVLEALRLLEHCANPSGYEFTAQDVVKIFTAIKSAVTHAESAYTAPKKTEKQGFAL